MSALGAKKALQAAFRDLALPLDTDALAILTDFLESSGGGQDIISRLLDEIAAENPVRITKEVATAAVAVFCGVNEQRDGIEVIDAFDMPKNRYDPIRKLFYRVKEAPRLHGLASDRGALYMDRTYLLYQRLQRNPEFNRPVFAHVAGLPERQYCELTDLKALLGTAGETRFVMGAISQLQDGQFFLEDFTDAVPIALDGAVTATGFYTENCVVVAEGAMQHNGTFKVTALGFPPLESREAAAAAAKGLDFFGGAPSRPGDEAAALDWEAAHPHDRVVILSDLWLDRPDTLDRLRLVLAGFEDLEAVPSLFVLMGNFSSRACAGASCNYEAIRTSFGLLAGVLVQFPRILAGSRLVFVPGPGDSGPGDVLPCPALPAHLTAAVRDAVPSAIFASNPCRIRHHMRQLVFFRSNVLGRMRKLCLLPPCGDCSTPEAHFEHLAVTLLQQSHLSPVALERQPVYWSYDHALQLHPQPHLLVAAYSDSAAHFEFAGCACLNPGSFENGTFAAYSPSTQESELCDVPDVEAE